MSKTIFTYQFLFFVAKLITILAARRKHNFNCIAVIVVLIFLPSVVKADDMSIINEGFKQNFSFFVLDKNLITNDIGNKTLDRNNVLSQQNLSINKSSSECSSSLIKISDSYVFFDSVKGKAMVYQCLDEIAHKTAENSKGKICYVINQLFHRPAFTFALGGIVTSLILELTFIYTQPVIR